jgi:hypothetical protein
MKQLKVYIGTVMNWVRPVQTVEAQAQHFIHVGLVDRRNYLAQDGVAIYLPKSKALVLEMRPAFGEPRRNPGKYLVKVMDQERGQIRTEVMRSTQPLVVL